MHFKIKVCGMTRERDALLAAKLGTDLIGMIFYSKSPRSITMKEARSITRALPATVQKVGVFVDEQVDRILEIGSRLLLDYIQLHGPYTSAQIRAIQKAGGRVINVYHVTSKKDYSRVLLDPADLVMLDNRSDDAVGGTGQTFDWGIRPPRNIPNLVLAGGISTDNLAEGIRRFTPLVVDVNSGVESRPGVKSPEKLKQFFAMCNSIRYGKNS